MHQQNQLLMLYLWGFCVPTPVFFGWSGLVKCLGICWATVGNPKRRTERHCQGTIILCATGLFGVPIKHVLRASRHCKKSREQCYGRNVEATKSSPLRLWVSQAPFYRLLSLLASPFQLESLMSLLARQFGSWLLQLTVQERSSQAHCRIWILGRIFSRWTWIQPWGFCSISGGGKSTN